MCVKVGVLLVLGALLALAVVLYEFALKSEPALGWLAPRPPFGAVPSPYVPSAVWGDLRPKPTNAWWTNLVVGTEPVVIAPYAVRFSGTTGIELGYGYARRTADEETVVDPFVADVAINVDGAYVLEAADELTATVKFREVTAILARGSPYLTLEAEGDLALEFPAGVARVDVTGTDAGAGSQDQEEGGEEASCGAHAGCSGLEGDCCPTSDGDYLLCCSALEKSAAATKEGDAFEVVAGDGRSWRAYMSKKLAVTVGDGSVVLQGNKYVLRLAYAPSDAAAALLDAHAATYPVAGRVFFRNFWSPYDFQWTTKSFSSSSRSPQQKEQQELLMLALPHHAASSLKVASSSSEEAGEARESELSPSLASLAGAWRCVKGPLTPVVGAVWSLTVPEAPGLPAAFPGEAPSFFASRSPRDAMTIALLAEADADAIPEDEDEVAFARASGVYSAGKRATKYASLAIAAQAAGAVDAAEKAALKAAEAVAPWLDPKTHLLKYDATYGGVCTTAGLADENADFGNGKYNDHHFHYGYHLYAAAVALEVLGLDRGLRALAGGENEKKQDGDPRRVKASLGALVADVASPLDDATPFLTTANLGPSRRRRGRRRLFPAARHKDFYDGHSWASGLFPLADGKSQESVSEASHCYYAVTLLGGVFGDWDLASWARFLLGLEVQAARTYWHVVHTDIVNLYPRIFAEHNSIVAVVGAADLHATTWFGSSPALAHLVNALPFTPLTEALLVGPYVQIAQRDVEAALDVQQDHQDDEDLAPWRSLYLQLLAVVDPDKARRRVLEMGLHDGSTAPPVLDTTQSLGAMLYWTNTRPKPPPDAPILLPLYLASTENDEVNPGAESQAGEPPGTPQNKTTTTTAKSAACDDHLKCRNLGITGDCCPAPGGVDLWCCD
mmetsp:Transcript_14120/g.46100  ORF Transcript_14120/g.46100 Transcript_14120/m.46100 type:complete len:900 (+) Transcript_14120:259-2958(+)